jgi:hypothetical protein
MTRAPALLGASAEASTASGPWRVEALDGATLAGGPAEVDLSLDRATGKDGDTIHLTIKTKKLGPEGFSTILLDSKLGGLVNHWAVLVVP